MADSLNLAMRISAQDFASGVLRRFRSRISGLGSEAGRVQRDYDRMVHHISRGIAGLAAADYGLHKLEPGVRAAADLQDSLLEVKQLLAGADTSAGKLSQQMKEVRKTAVQVAENLPFDATDIVNIERNLKQGGVGLNSIIGRHGAAYSTAALSAISKLSPETVSRYLVKIGDAYQLHGSQFSTAANTLAKVSTASSADLAELFYNLKEVGPSAHALNIPLSTTADALGSVASLDDQAGTSLDAYLRGLAGTTPRAQKALHYLGVSFFNKKGQFVGFDESLKRLRHGLAGVASQQSRLIILQRIFGREGQRAAHLLVQTGNNSVESIKKRAAAADDLQQREQIAMSGLIGSIKKLGGTSYTTLANLFSPMLDPLTEAVTKTNELVGNIGDLAEKHKALADAVSGGGALAVAGAGLYGLSHLARGLPAGGRVLKSIVGGAGKTAAGIAEGKAIQAASGVAPVFVVNWPAGFGSNGPINNARKDETAAANTAKNLAKDGAWAAMLGRGGVIGAGIWGLYHKISGEMHELSLSRADLQKQVLNAPFGLGHGAHRTGHSPEDALSGTLKIELTQDGRLRLKSLQKDGLLDFDVDTDNGPSMVLP